MPRGLSFVDQGRGIVREVREGWLGGDLNLCAEGGVGGG